MALAAVVLSGCTGGGGSATNAGGVAKIKARGYLSCSGSQGIPGLSRADENGVWRGFDSDVCRAFAAAILGDAQKVRFVPLNAAQRLPALQTGEIDVLSRTSTLTFTRDMAVRFVAVTLYDSDAVLVRKSLGVKSPADLGGKTVCMQGGGYCLGTGNSVANNSAAYGGGLNLSSSNATLTENTITGNFYAGMATRDLR